MKFTLSWLKDHLDTSASLSEIADKLVALGLEVEGIEDPSQALKGFVVAHVVEAGRHPNADRLSLCYADIGGREKVQVVCGAPNVRAGMKVAFAPVGVVIPASGTVLKKGKIRDIESCGMFCSARELQLGEDQDGILDLQTSLPVGSPLAQALGLTDPVIDVSLTPNRADCFGVRGIARDLAASGIGVLKPFPYEPTTGEFVCPVTVTIEDLEVCPDFQVRLLKGVRNGASPDWVQNRLRAIGQRPISALVDVTTYLTYDLGRPLHVFDAAKIQGNLTVRLSKAGQTLSLLNGKDIVLEDGMTVIADDARVVSLGGIMGGQETGCSEETVDVLIECAAFDPVRIAQTGRALNLLSDARTRFERGVDPASIRPGLEAATDLILRWCGGKASQIAPFKNPLPHPVTIALTQDKITGLSGCPITLKEAWSFLEKLGFQLVSLTELELSVTVPSHRQDVEGPADLVEEVLRLQGYDQIPPIPLPPAPAQSQSSPSSLVRRVLATRGLLEAVTWSFMDQDLAVKFGGGDPSLRLSNPLSEEWTVMRPSIVPNLIQAAIRNQDRGQTSVPLFEVGPQFNGNGQQLVATGVIAGLTGPRHWAEPPRVVDVFDAKAHVLATLAALGIAESALQIEASSPDYYHPGRKGRVKQGNKVFALFGEIHPALITSLGGQGSFGAFEIFLDQIPAMRSKISNLTLSPYQSVVRDFAFVVDKSVSADQIIKAITKVDRGLILHIFDVYEGEKIDPAQKSLAIQVRFDPLTGTLTEAQITELCDKIISNVFKVTGGILRHS
jgi:phenylalanyl-tRNA synthetase beta chain